MDKKTLIALGTSVAISLATASIVQADDTVNNSAQSATSAQMKGAEGKCSAAEMKKHDGKCASMHGKKGKKKEKKTEEPKVERSSD